MNELKKMFDLGPAEMTREQVERSCAQQAIALVAQFEPKCLLSRDDASYGLPKLPEDAC